MKTPKDKPRKKRKPSKDEDGAALWRKVTETVAPLKGREPPPQETGALPPPPDLKRIAVRPKVEALAPPPPLPQLTHGFQPGLDKATEKRLKRGKVQIEGRIDLHGMTQDEARPALERFIEAAWRGGKREVLVITGKGTRADGAIGVLRQMVPQWLNDPVNRQRITAFRYAAVKDGGEGALYVRIKKRTA